MKFAKHWVATAVIAMAAAAQAAPLPFSEGFDNLSAWTLINYSTDPGSTWFQGNSGIFASQAGAANSYAAASFASANTGAIDNWLISPELTLGGASDLTFWTRAEVVAGFHDSMEVLFSAGAGTAKAGFASILNVGNDPAIDYPALWTKYLVSLPSAASGRVAFRYYGDSGTSNYIGVDSFGVAAAVPEPSTYALMALGLAGVSLVRRSRRAD